MKNPRHYIKHLAMTLAVLGLTTLVLPASPASAQILSVPRNVFGIGGNEFDQRIAVDAAGNIYIVWRHESGFIRFSRSTNGGVSFTAPQVLSMPGVYSLVPDITVDSAGTIYVAWSEAFTRNDIVLRRSNDHGVTFSDAFTLHSGVDFAGSARLAADCNGALHVVWIAEPGPGLGIDLFYSRSNDGGHTFSSPTNISNTEEVSAFEEFGKILAVDNVGNPYVVWFEGQQEDVFFSHSTDGGETFLPPTNISNTTGQAFQPQLAVTATGQVAIVWLDSGTGNLDVLFSGSTDAGATFSSPKNVSNSTGSTFPAFNLPLLRLGVDVEGNLFVAWMDDIPGNPEILFSRSTDAGTTFSSPLNLSATAADSLYPDLHVDSGGNVTVAWGDSLDRPFSTGSIFFRRSTDGGATFGRTISTGTNGPLIPILASDSRGSSYLVWEAFPFSGDIFFSRTLDELFQDLIDKITEINEQQHIPASLDTKLDVAIRVLEDVHQSNDVAARQNLQSFITEVENQRGVKISDADADSLVGMAGDLLALLGD